MTRGRKARARRRRRSRPPRADPKTMKAEPDDKGIPHSQHPDPTQMANIREPRILPPRSDEVQGQGGGLGKIASNTSVPARRFLHELWHVFLSPLGRSTRKLSKINSCPDSSTESASLLHSLFLAIRLRPCPASGSADSAIPHTKRRSKPSGIYHFQRN